MWLVCDTEIAKTSLSKRHNGCSRFEFEVCTYSQQGPRLLIKQTTLGSAVETYGIGLHTAVPVHIRLVPAPPDTGYVFRRTDLGGFEIPATVESVAHCGYATTLMRTGVMLNRRTSSCGIAWTRRRQRLHRSRQSRNSHHGWLCGRLCRDHRACRHRRAAACEARAAC